MKITIKLKHTQVTSLAVFLENLIQTEECTSRTEAIVTVLMVKFYTKLKKATIMLEPRNYTFGIEPETAMAFVQFFEGMPIEHGTHGGNITRQLMVELDQQTSKFF